MSVVVFGSINMDLVVRTPRFPDPGETMTGRNFFTAPGGKGANQAVAASRLGLQTRMVGRVGADVFGPALIQSLQASGVNTEGVLIDPQQPSGTALITVDDSAENSIIIIPGANGAVSESDLARLEDALEGARFLMLQLEIPLGMVVTAAHLAHKRGVKVILDPAPARRLPKEFYDDIDIITPNEGEASALSGVAVQGPEDAAKAAASFLACGVRNAVIKLGSKGVFWSNGKEQLYVPAYKVKAVDTVAAGDAFNGGFVAGLDEGLSMAEALKWAAAGGALSTTKEGAQPSMPDRATLMAFLKEQAG
jgi:ribokinase